jgi:hypothetical protein
MLKSSKRSILLDIDSNDNDADSDTENKFFKIPSKKEILYAYYK